MLCEKCGKNIATTHIRSVVNGVMNEMNLCSECAMLGGYHNLTNSGLSGLLSSMLSNESKIYGNTLKRCECCGATFSNIADSGKVGCSMCYETFRTELLPYLKKVHGSTRHIGKIPSKSHPEAPIPEITIESLRARMKDMVMEEKFEEAAKLRDQIQKMEEESKQ